LKIDTLPFPKGKDFHIPVVMIINDLELFFGIGLGTWNQTCNLLLAIKLGKGIKEISDFGMRPDRVLL
jgi:hypothetical protein